MRTATRLDQVLEEDLEEAVFQVARRLRLVEAVVGVEMV